MGFRIVPQFASFDKAGVKAIHYNSVLSCKGQGGIERWFVFYRIYGRNDWTKINEWINQLINKYPGSQLLMCSYKFHSRVVFLKVWSENYWGFPKTLSGVHKIKNYLPYIEEICKYLKQCRSSDYYFYLKEYRVFHEMYLLTFMLVSNGLNIVIFT